MGVKINYVKKSTDLADAAKQVSAAKLANMAAGPGHISVKYDELTSTQQTMKEVMEKAFEGIDDNDPMALSKGVANFQKIVNGGANLQQVPKKIIPSNPLKGMFGKKPAVGAPLTANGKPAVITVEQDSPGDMGAMVASTSAKLAEAGVQTEDGKPIQSIQFVNPDTGAVEHEFKNPFGGAYPEQDPANEDEGADEAGYAPAYQHSLTPMPPDPEPQPFDQQDPKAFKKLMAAFYMTLVKKPAQTKKG